MADQEFSDILCAVPDSAVPEEDLLQFSGASLPRSPTTSRSSRTGSHEGAVGPGTVVKKAVPPQAASPLKKGRNNNSRTSVSMPSPPSTKKKVGEASPRTTKTKKASTTSDTTVTVPKPISLASVARTSANVRGFQRNMNKATLKRRLSSVAGWAISDEDIERFNATFDAEEEADAQRQQKEQERLQVLEEQALQAQRMQEAQHSAPFLGASLARDAEELLQSLHETSHKSKKSKGNTHRQSDEFSPAKGTGNRSRSGSATRHTTGRRLSTTSNTSHRSSVVSHAPSAQQQHQGSGGRVHFGTSRAMDNAARTAEKAKRRYERLLLYAQQESAARRIQRWYRETKAFSKALANVRAMRKLKKAMNVMVFRWVCKVRARKREREERRLAEEALQKKRRAAASKIQRVARCFLSRLQAQRIRRNGASARHAIAQSDRREFAALTLQSWWRQRLAWFGCKLMIRGAKSMKATRFTFAIRQFLMFKHGQQKKAALMVLHDEAAKMIQRNVRRYLKEIKKEQVAFLRANKLCVPSTLL